LTKKNKKVRIKSCRECSRKAKAIKAKAIKAKAIKASS
jgi:hypothetical protein